MKTLNEFLSESIKSSDIDSDLKKLGDYKDQHGGYHLYKLNKTVSTSDFVKLMNKHGFKHQEYSPLGTKHKSNAHIYQRTPGPYRTESVYPTFNSDGVMTHINRSVQ